MGTVSQISNSVNRELSNAGNTVNKGLDTPEGRTAAGFMVGGPLGAGLGAASGGKGGSLLGNVAGGLGLGGKGKTGQMPGGLDSVTAAALAAQQQQQGVLNTMAPQQSQFNEQLAQQALGQQISPAMQQAMQQNNAAQIGMAKSMKGGNQALAQRNVAMNAANAQQQAMLGGTAQAQGMYGNYLGQQQNYNAQLMGAASGAAGAQAQNAIQQKQMQNQKTGGLLGAAGAGIGLMMGGPAGGAAGATIGSGVGKAMAHGGEVQPGNHYVNYFNTMMQGGQVQGMNAGGTTDSLKNDTVPTMLSPGEIVIPKSVVNGPNPKANAAKFVEAILSKQGLRK